MSSLVMTPLWVIILLLNLAALIAEVTALVIALKTPSPAYTAASKMSKGAWVAITAIGTLIGLGAMPIMPFRSGINGGGFLSIVAVVAALVFLTDVRPAVKQYRGGGRAGPPTPGSW
ncbi:MAG: DUF2516 family protein [Bifidobacteriaceae bacterium]|jgi:hypothetical protein|nr:DUF2516 family protein [Bifidobacteriaceae bacterium]